MAMGTELIDQFLHALDCSSSQQPQSLVRGRYSELTAINDTDIHAEGFAGEVGHIAHIVA